MAESLENARIAAALDTLRAYGVVPGVARALRGSADAMVRELQETVLA